MTVLSKKNMFFALKILFNQSPSVLKSINPSDSLSSLPPNFKYSLPIKSKITGESPCFSCEQIYPLGL